MMNAGVTNGLRVYVLSIPPGGNFIIGATEQFTPPPYVVNAFSQNGFTTSSVNFVNCAGPSITFVKLRDETALVYRMAMSCFTSEVNVTEVEFGILLSGPNWPSITGDYPVCSQFINAGNQHEVITGFLSVPKGAVPAGTYTITPRVRNLNGAHIINMNDDDRCSYEIEELGMTL
jgi:hypothetical protein